MLSDNLLFAVGTVATGLALAGILWIWRFPSSIRCHCPLFSPARRAFLGQLDMAVSTHLAVFPEVPVATVLTARKLGRLRLYLKLLGGEKTFDYILCDRKTMMVVCAISLGGKKGVSRRQKKLRTLCALADLPLLEYKDKPYRNVPALRRQIFLTCGIDEQVFFEEQTESFSPRQSLSVMAREKA